MIDILKNFAKTTLGAGLDAVATTVQLAPGGGAKLPDPGTGTAFYAVIHNATDFPDPSDDPTVEIVRVNAIVGDVITQMDRAQDGTVASPHNLPGKVYRILVAITEGLLKQIRNNFPAVYDAILPGASSSTAGVTVMIAGLKSTTYVALSWGKNPNNPPYSELFIQDQQDGQITIVAGGDEINDKNIRLFVFGETFGTAGGGAATVNAPIRQGVKPVTPGVNHVDIPNFGTSDYFIGGRIYVDGTYQVFEVIPIWSSRTPTGFDIYTEDAGDYHWQIQANPS